MYVCVRACVCVCVCLVGNERLKLASAIRQDWCSEARQFGKMLLMTSGAVAMMLRTKILQAKCVAGRITLPTLDTYFHILSAIISYNIIIL
jgi:hypothetical protein